MDYAAIFFFDGFGFVPCAFWIGLDAALMGVVFYVLVGIGSLAAVTGVNTNAASARKSNSPSRGMPGSPARASRMANPVRPSFVRASLVESRTSSAVCCSFSFSPARSSARSSAKVYGSSSCSSNQSS